MKIKHASFNLTLLLLYLFVSHYTSGQTVGSKFNSADGKITFTVTAVGSPNKVSVKKNGTPLGKLIIPDTVVYDDITYAVVGIEASAFKSCTGLDTLTIGRNIETIGNFAFYSCPNFKQINFLATACNDLAYNTNAFSSGSSVNCAVYIGNNVKRIPANLFLGCSLIRSVTFGEASSCSHIGDNAFSYCNNKALTTFTIPDSVQTIGPNAFLGSSYIATLTLGSGIVSISKNAFSDMQKLTKVYYNATNCNDLTESIFNNFYASTSSNFDVLVGKNVPRIPSKLFYISPTIRSLEFESGAICTEIGNSAFELSSNLTTASLPNSVKTIGSRAFMYCRALCNFALPVSITNVGDLAFSSCVGLSSIYLPESLHSLGEAVFAEANCTFLVDATNPFFTVVDSVLYNKDQTELIQFKIGRTGHFDIPASVKSIRVCAFASSVGLTSITIPNSVRSIGGSAFFGCAGLTALQIPGSVTRIEDATFCYCTGLNSLTLPEGLSAIGDYAFANCTGLKTVNFSTTLKFIGSECFYGCTGLSQLTIPQSVVSIGDNAFYNCQNLATVVMQNPTPPTFSGANIFSYTNSRAKLYVPIGSKKAYFLSYQSAFDSGNNIIEAAEFLTDNGWKYIVTDTTAHHLTLIEHATADSGSITIPEKVYHQNTWYSVREIGNDAFSNHNKLTSVTLPNTVRAVGNFAFYNCTGLTTINLPQSVASLGMNAFQNCTSLTAIDLPDSVTNIGSYTFQNCTNLKNVSVGKTLTSVGNNAFQACSGLSDLSFPNSLDSIGAYAFQSCTNLKTCKLGTAQGTISTYCFQGCSSLTSITIPDSTTSIEPYAFSDCSNLTSIDLGNKLSNIATYAFQNCTSLASLIVPESMTTIAEFAFMNCTGLKTMDFNAINCTSIGTKPSALVVKLGFKNCTALTSIHVGEKVKQIPNDAFFQCSALTTLTGCSALTSIGESAFGGCPKLMLNAIPDSVTTIGINAFYGCNGITSLVLGNNLKSIGINAFNYCRNLVSVVFNATDCPFMGSFSSPVFANCNSFTDLVIGDSVKLLPNCSFVGCTKLATVTMRSSIPPTLGSSSVFTNIPTTAKLYVPLGSKSNYTNYNSNNLTYTSNFSSLGSTTDGSRIIELTTGFNDPNCPTLTLYFNSARQLVIQSNQVLSGQISVFNCTGQLQATGSLSGTTTTLTKALPPNVYLVLIQSSNTIRKEKIVIV